MKAMRVFILTGILFLCLMGHAMAATQCPDAPRPVYNLRAEISEPRLDFSMGREALNEKFFDIPLPDPHIYHRELGAVMTARMRLDYDLNMQETTLEDGQLCIAFQTLDITLSADPVIYLSSEFQKETCNFKFFLEHELKHVEIDRAVIAEYTPRVLEILDLAFAEDNDWKIGPLPPSIGDEAKDSLRAHVEGALNVAFTHLMTARMERQQALDSVEEYLDLARACAPFSGAY